MRAKIARQSVGAIFFLLALGLLPVFIGVAPVMASDTFPDIFNSLYPASQSGNNASCRLCHTTSTSQLNQYGRDFAVQFSSGMTETQSFRAIESLNSDNASANNLVEINANPSAQPGWTPGAVNTIYNRTTLAVAATNQSPPATITGLLDPAAASPSVSVAATDATAAEAPLSTGTFTVTRTGATTAALTVAYTVGGTATAGSDYTALTGSVSIPAGAASAPITVTPLNDTVVEANETVILTLATNAAYTVGTPNSAR